MALGRMNIGGEFWEKLRVSYRWYCPERENRITEWVQMWIPLSPCLFLPKNSENILINSTWMIFKIFSISEKSRKFSPHRRAWIWRFLLWSWRHRCTLMWSVFLPKRGVKWCDGILFRTMDSETPGTRSSLLRVNALSHGTHHCQWSAPGWWEMSWRLGRLNLRLR